MGARLYKIIFFVLGLGTLAYMFYALGPSEIWKSLLQTGWWFVPILLSWLFIYLMNAYAFQAVIGRKKARESKLSFAKIFQLTVTGYSINYITPFVGLGGEPYRIMELNAYLGSAKAGSSVLLYSMMHILSHLLFWLLSIGLIIAFVPLSKPVLIACLLILLLSGLLCYWFSKVYKQGLSRSVFSFLSKLPWIGKRIGKFAAEKKDLFADIDIQIQDLFVNRKQSFYTALTWEFLARVLGCLEILLIAWTLGAQMTYVEALIVSSGSSLFANLIFFFPLQLGTREGGMAMAMVSVGYAASLGILIGVATRIRELIWIGIGLIFMLFTKKVKEVDN